MKKAKPNAADNFYSQTEAQADKQSICAFPLTDKAKRTLGLLRVNDDLSTAEIHTALKKLSFIIHHSSIIIFLDLDPRKNFCFEGPVHITPFVLFQSPHS